MPTSLSASSRSLRPSVFIVFSLHVPYSYTFALEKLSLNSLRTRRHYLDALLFLFRPIVALSPALPFWKMFVFVSLLAMLGTSQSLAFVPLTNTALLLGAHIQPTWWVKILTYLQSERFLFIIFYNLVFKLSMIVKAIVLNPYVHMLCSF
jgi:hypothetical protein